MISFDAHEIIAADLKNRKKDYNAIHNWLRTVYGKPNKCDNIKCKGIGSGKFDWAKVKDKEYDFKRENFIMLCKSCHYYYDEKFKNIRKKEMAKESGIEVTTEDFLN